MVFGGSFIGDTINKIDGFTADTFPDEDYIRMLVVANDLYNNYVMENYTGFDAPSIGPENFLDYWNDLSHTDKVRLVRGVLR